MSDEGLSIRKVAAALGVSKSCVDWYLYGYGNKSPEAIERRWRLKLPTMKEAIRKAAQTAQPPQMEGK
jgi:predicted transcriptional regulator